MGRVVLFVAVVALSVAVGIWANLWKNEMRIEQVRTEGNTIIPGEEIVGLARADMGSKLFETDVYAIQMRVAKNLYIRSVAVMREVPGTLVIRVDERTPMAVVVTGDLFFVDETGFVLPSRKSEHLLDLPVLTGVRESSVVPGRRMENPAVQEGLHLLLLSRQIDDELYRRISEVHIRKDNEIIVYTAEFGIPVMFGRGEIGMKLAKMHTFWREVVSERGPEGLAYIDLRFTEQVVVRWKTASATVAPPVSEKRKS